jgi:NTE family protein
MNHLEDLSYNQNIDLSHEQNKQEIIDLSSEEQNIDLSNNQNEEENINLSNEEENINLSNEEENKQIVIDTLCFSGGGVKGFAFIGALERLIELEKINLSNINRFVGTSAGAILSFLLNIGVDIIELKDFILTFNFSKLNGKIDSNLFFERHGINNGEKLIFIFIKFLESKLNVCDITFIDLFNKTNKELIIIGTNYTRGIECVFSKDKTPDFSVIKAIRISISVPVIFTPVCIDNEYYVDGAIINNFPINYCPKDTTFGFYIKNSTNKNIIDNFPNYILNCLGIIADSNSEKYIADYNNIITIQNITVEMTNFDLNQQYKESIIQLGFDSVNNFYKI